MACDATRPRHCFTASAGELEIEGHELEALIFGDEARRRNLPGWGD